MNALNTDTFEQFTFDLPPGATKMHAQNLDFFYGKHQALHSVSLPILEKGVTALIGPSGCGKSTLLRVMNRIYALYPGQVAKGAIMLDGENILDRKIDVATLRSRVGMVFQKPTPFPMSIYDNVAFGVRLYESLGRSEMDQRVEESLGLSGGQQQRLCIARGIAVKPEVLLLDEPASALDPVSTAKLEETVVELKSEYTIVIVTHNLQQATRVSDNTGFMFLGRLIEFTSTEQLFTNPKGQRTQDYVTGRFG